MLLSDRRLDRLHKAALSGRVIPYFALYLAIVTMLAAVAVRLLARGEFTSMGESIWWAAQTVTTVGYGDVIPGTTFSKAIAVIVMFLGIAAVSLTTAVVTSALMNVTQHRLGDPQTATLRRIEERLAAIEKHLEQKADSS